MTDEVIQQIIIQAPTVAVLMYLLFRLDARLDELINTIVELATDDRDPLPRE